MPKVPKVNKINEVEIWKPIIGLLNYYASNKGNISKMKKGLRFVYKTPKHRYRGYYKLTIRVNGIKKRYRRSVLVAIAFHNHVPCGHKVIVDHKDNDKTNDRPDNLQLITPRLNTSKDKKNKTSKYTGVSWVENRNKWRAAIRVGKKLKYLGLFLSEIDAHTAYQNELKTI